MGIGSRIKGMFARARDKPQSTPPTNVSLGLSGIFGGVGEKSMTNSEAICAAVHRLASTMGCMPVHLYKNFRIQEDHPLEKLMAFAPNANMTPYTWRYTMMACMGIYGCAYGLIVPNEQGWIDSIDVIDPSRVTVLKNQENGEIWYQVTLDDGKQIYVHNSSMLDPKWSSMDGVHYISPLEVLGATLKYDRAIKEISIRQLDGINGAAILTFPTALSEERKADITKRFLETYQKSRGQVLILDGGVTVDKITGSVVDAGVLNSDNITKSKIASVYGMPIRMVGAEASTDYSTSEQVMREFMTLTMLTEVRKMEDMLHRKVLGCNLYQQGYRFHYSMEEMLRGDSSAMAERHHKGIRDGKLLINEARAEDYLPPVERGDEMLVARDMIPLRVVVDKPELLLSGKIPMTDGEPKAGGGEK